MGRQMRIACVVEVSAALLLGLTACGGDSSGDSGGSTAGTTAATGGNFEIFPPQIFSGTDSQHIFRAPIIAVNAPAEVEWTIADPNIATISPDSGNSSELMVTIKAPGTTTITATSSGQSVTASLESVGYTPEQYAAGEHRYKNAADEDNPACNECHAPGKGPDHTATELDADPDNQVQNTFLSGVDPENRPIADESEYAYLLEGKDHMWTVTEEERIGLLAYLRALEPMGYPEYDAPTAEKEE